MHSLDALHSQRAWGHWLHATPHGRVGPVRQRLDDGSTAGQQQARASTAGVASDLVLNHTTVRFRVAITELQLYKGGSNRINVTFLHIHSRAKKCFQHNTCNLSKCEVTPVGAHPSGVRVRV